MTEFNSKINSNLCKLALIISLSVGVTAFATGTEPNNSGKTYYWGENGGLGTIGQIFRYDNPFNEDREYFKLIGLDDDKKYGYLPTDKIDNKYWQYLGLEIADDYLYKWGDNDRLGAIGNVYFYNNPQTKDTEYFELIGLDKDKKYSYFPTDKSNNKYWEYLGTDKPAHISGGGINPLADRITPVITIKGDNPVELELGTVYTDAGATAIDNVDGDITANIETTGEVDINTVGSYKIVYAATDKAGNQSSKTRVINVADSNNGNGYIPPPHPGRAGKKTLEGIDSNNNKVRDDVEIAIYEKFPNVEDKPKRDALFQKAVAIQESLLSGNNGDRGSIEKARLKIDKASDCRIKQIPDMRKRYDLSRFVTGEVINTRARSNAYDKFNRSLSGGTYSSIKLDKYCEEFQ